MSDDVVMELERWLAVWPNHLAGSIDVAVIQRARDEIVALRRYKHENHEAMEVISRAAELIKTQEVGALSEAKRLIRAEALEEAARIADGYVTNRTDDVAVAIRALKEKARDAVAKYSLK